MSLMIRSWIRTDRLRLDLLGFWMEASVARLQMGFSLNVVVSFFLDSSQIWTRASRPLWNRVTKSLLLVICQWTFDCDGFLRSSQIITVLITHVGYQAYCVLMFLLECMGLTSSRHDFVFPYLWQLSSFPPQLHDLTRGWWVLSKSLHRALIAYVGNLT